MPTAQHDITEYLFTLHGAPNVTGRYGELVSRSMTVTLYTQTGTVFVHIAGRAVLKKGGVGKSNRQATFTLHSERNTAHPYPPEWVLDMLEKFPALAYMAASCRERKGA